MEMPLNMHFTDKVVTYEQFLGDLSARVASMLHTDLTDPEWMSQRQASMVFGRANVERWRASRKIQPKIYPGKVMYRTCELRLLQRIEQNYQISRAGSRLK